VFFLHLFWKMTFGEKWLRFLAMVLRETHNNQKNQEPRNTLNKPKSLFQLPLMASEQGRNWVYSSKKNPRNWSLHSAINKHRTTASTTTTNTVLQPLNRTTCVSQHPQLKTRKFLLEQSFTACMPRMTATSALGLWTRCQSSLHWCYLHHLHTVQMNTENIP